MLRDVSKLGPIVFLPTHRSYIDFIVISYICFSENLPVPCIAAGEVRGGIPLHDVLGFFNLMLKHDVKILFIFHSVFKILNIKV